MDLYLKPLRLSDTTPLKRQGLSSSVAHQTLSAEWIQRVISDPQRHYYIVADKENGQYLALAGLVAHDDYPLCASFFLYLASKDKSNCAKILSVESLCMKHGSSVVYHAVKGVLDIAFFSLGYFRVNWILSRADGDKEKAAMAVGMQQKAILEDLAEAEGLRSIDGGLFSVTAVEYSEYAVGFVPYENGVAAVYGGREYVDRIALFSYGDMPEDDFTRRSAVNMGILDDAYRFRHGSREAVPIFERTNALPGEVQKALCELREYFSGARRFFTVRLRVNMGTVFQQKVWSFLRTIPFGQTCSYEDVAERVLPDPAAGKPTRAVGGACRANPIPILIPCHRVIGKNNRLTGFRAGLDKKAYLLEHEMFGALTK